MFDCDRMTSNQKRHITKADLIFLFILLICAFVLLIVFRFFGKTGNYAEIIYDGMVLERISLSQDDGQYYLLTYQPVRQDEAPSDEFGEGSLISYELSVSIHKMSQEEWKTFVPPSGDYNVLTCQDGVVRMIQSSCPDQICVHHAAISRTGECIICLPHKLVIKVTDGGENTLDGVAY